MIHVCFWTCFQKKNIPLNKKKPSINLKPFYKKKGISWQVNKKPIMHIAKLCLLIDVGIYFFTPDSDVGHSLCFDRGLGGGGKINNIYIF